MHLMYFTEQPMSAYDEQAGRDFGATALMFSNRFFDPVAGSRLYNEYLDHYRLAEAVGFDGIMLNEHHNAPFCMQAKCNVFASILAAATSRVKIVLLGNPLPLADNPVRLAEELAMIDMISGGRLVSGFVRGGGQEQLAAGVNPAYNRERFDEAAAVIVKAWTQTGPFRWEGPHYQHRVVNPWAVPLQKPHPRVWIPGVLSKETIVWAARKRYPYIALSTEIEATKKIWELYDQVAQQTGYAGGPEYRGYLQRCHVAETEEKAMANAKQFMWMQGEFTGLAHPVWSSPSGYFSPSYRTAFVEYAVGRRANPRAAAFELDMATTTVAAGKVKVYKLNHEALPPGWVVDDKGQPVTDPEEAFKYVFERPEGGITPLGGSREAGGHKGYGLAVMVHILGGVLAGASFSPLRNRTQKPSDPHNLGHFFLAIDPRAFRAPGAFEDDLDEVIDVLHGARRADAVQPVLVAGDPEMTTRAERLRDGVPLPDDLLVQLRAVAASAGVPFVL